MASAPPGNAQLLRATGAPPSYPHVPSMSGPLGPMNATGLENRLEHGRGYLDGTYHHTFRGSAGGRRPKAVTAGDSECRRGTRGSSPSAVLRGCPGPQGHRLASGMRCRDHRTVYGTEARQGSRQTCDVAADAEICSSHGCPRPASHVKSRA